LFQVYQYIKCVVQVLLLVANDKLLGLFTNPPYCRILSKRGNYCKQYCKQRRMHCSVPLCSWFGPV